MIVCAGKKLFCAHKTIAANHTQSVRHSRHRSGSSNVIGALIARTGYSYTADDPGHVADRGGPHMLVS